MSMYLVTVQGQAHWISPMQWGILHHLSRHKNVRVASLGTSLVHEHAVEELRERGWIYFRDTETRPLSGPIVELTREGEAAVDTGLAWIKGIGTTKKRRDPSKKMTRRKKALSDNEHGAQEVRLRLRELGISKGYAPIAVYGPGRKYPLPDVRYPQVFRALYEAVDYVDDMFHRGIVARNARVIVVQTDGYSSSAPVWDSRKDKP